MSVAVVLEEEIVPEDLPDLPKLVLIPQEAVYVFLSFVHGGDPLPLSIGESMETSRIHQPGLQTQFVEFCHCIPVHRSLVKHLGAVILDNPNRLATILQQSPPPRFSDE